MLVGPMLGLMLGHFGPMLGPCWAHVGPMLGLYWPMSYIGPIKLISVATKFGNLADFSFFKTRGKTWDSRGKMPPPKQKIDSYCNCLRITRAWKECLGTSGASAFAQARMVETSLLRVTQDASLMLPRGYMTG